MADHFVTGFIPKDAGEIILMFQRSIALANRSKNKIMAAALEGVLARYLTGMERLTIGSAAYTEEAMKRRFSATKKRVVNTGKGPGLRQALSCRPIIFAAGVPLAVGVADVDKLNRVTNPLTGYGPYWHAQEEGTGGKVPSQVGREIFGLFLGKGGGGQPERPNPKYAGGGGPHPIFVSGKSQSAAFGSVGFSGGAGKQGGVGGPGTISVEITGRHFIRDGAALGASKWAQGLLVVERTAIAGLAEIGLAPGRRPAATRKVERVQSRRVSRRVRAPRL